MEAIKLLPANYNFEIPKILWRIRQGREEEEEKVAKEQRMKKQQEEQLQKQEEGGSVENVAKESQTTVQNKEEPETGAEKHTATLEVTAAYRVALQFPEGLLMYALVIADILTQYGNVEVLILGDVTYGACCVDDLTAHKLGCHLLVHFGHSCLVPIGDVKVKVLYVFVEISFDESHLVDCIKLNFPDKAKRIAIMGTIQFQPAVHSARQLLAKEGYPAGVPQAKPLSMGETLGCTSPVLTDYDLLVFVADGRFHLEAAMIQNPNLPAYRYDPYSKVLTSEGYDTETMHRTRQAAIERFRSPEETKRVGLVLGTLGRQGSPEIFKVLRNSLEAAGKRVIPFLMAELNPTKLAAIPVDAWVQVCCPRLSIDWAGGFSKPILTPYEAQVAVRVEKWRDVYPMDFYSTAGGSYANMYHRKPLTAKVQVAGAGANAGRK
jgi:2-(3-amino-3-carboxypropyl)histidine synthase